jgi:hypothetical protein
MALDLRKAIGWLLLALGVQLVAFGAISEGAGRAMNLQWGSAITVAGGLFHLAARRKSRP